MNEIGSIPIAGLSQLASLSAEKSMPSNTADGRLRSVAVQFETSFLAEMLKHTGVGKMNETFNGGAGESAFSGMLTWEYAEEIASSGKIGLADRVYDLLRERVKS